MNVEEGDTYLGEGKALFTIADEQNYIVSASVDEYDISSISADMTAAVIVEALGEDELAGKVWQQLLIQEAHLILLRSHWMSPIQICGSV